MNESAGAHSLSVSDHAVLRFLERAYGLAPLIAAARHEIAHGAQPAIDFNAPVAIVHGCRLVIREGQVVTALPKPKGAGDRKRAHRGRDINKIEHSGVSE